MAQAVTRGVLMMVAIAIEELNKVDAWGSANRGELATELAALWGRPKPVADLTVALTAYGTTPMRSWPAGPSVPSSSISPTT